MVIKHIIKRPLRVGVAALAATLLTACSGSGPVDAVDQLARPPQLVVTPSSEPPTITDETVISNGLGKNVKLLGKKTAAILKLNMDFDNAWQLLGKVLRLHKITITDHDREQGHYLVNFDTDAYKAEAGFFSGLSERLFTESYGLRKYRLTMKQTGESTFIIATDIGAITTEADVEDGVDEVVDSKVKGPDDSEFRLVSTLYKTLRDGFVEPEVQHKRD